MKQKSKEKIERHFRRIKADIFWRSDLAKILDANRANWGAPSLTTPKMADVLVDVKLLKRSQFTSPKYRPIVRYIRGSPSPYRLALSLRRESFLCHQTALVLHGLDSPSDTIYANREQSEKPEPSGLTQAGIKLAFKNQQRLSNYRFQCDGHQYLLISGKNTGSAGVVRMSIHSGEQVDCTDLERTLIDIVVRPAYAGGLTKVVAVYQAAFRKVDLDHLVELLCKLDYVYPYAQSIGFLLQRAGRPEGDLKQLEELRSEYEFFLDYGMKVPLFDEKWRLHYPAALRLSRAAEQAK